MARNENFAKWPKNSWSPPKKYLETSTNTAMLSLGPFDPPKRAKNGHAQKVPLVGQTHKYKFLSCSIHYFESPCKKLAQTDKRFLRYSVFKTRWIWLAESFSAMFWAKKIKIAIFPQRMKPEKSFCTLSLLELSNFDDFLGLFWDYSWAKGPKREKTKNSYRLVFWKNCLKSKKKILVT